MRRYTIGHANRQDHFTLKAASAAVTVDAAFSRMMQSIQATNLQNQLFTQSLVQQSISMQQGIAVNDNYTDSHSHLGTALRLSAKAAIDYSASTLATAGAVGAGVLAFGTLLGVLGPIYLAYKTVKEGIDLASEAWELGTAKLQSYVDVAKKAAATDLSTSYFQKIAKAATDANIPIDSLTKAMDTLQKQSADQLGGSPLQNRLTASVKAGNFANNPGVDQLSQANTLQEKFAAVSTLVHQAMQDGQRLAAIDITNTALGSEAADNLRKDSDYFDKINAAAAKVSDKDIVSDADVGRALDLQNRYTAAVSILEQRWHPIQDILTQGGINMHVAWVGVVESVASGVDGVTKMVEKIGQIPKTFWDYIQTGANAVGKFAIDNFTTPESRKSAEASFGISSDPADMARGSDAYGAAIDKLRSGLQNQAAVQQSVTTATTVYNHALTDTSHAIDTNTKSVAASRDQYDRAVDTLQKHIAQLGADTAALGLGAGALEEFRAKAALVTAAQLAGKPITDQLTASINAQAVAAGVAADANAKAKVASSIDFNSKTMFLSADDVSIATELKGIYGNDVPKALNSTYASAIQVNTAFKSVSSAIDTNLTSGLTDIVSGTKSVSQGFSDMSSAVIKSIEEMIIKLTVVQPLMRALQLGASSLGIGGLSGGVNANGSIAGAVGPTSVGGAPLVTAATGGHISGPGTGTSDSILARLSNGEFVVNAASTAANLPTLHAINNNHAFADGGPVGNVVPLRSPPSGGSNSAAPIINVHNYGSTPATVTQGKGPNGSIDIVIDQRIEAGVTKSLSTGNGRRVLANQYGVKQFTGQ